MTIHITQDARIQGIVDSIFSDPSNFQDYTYYELDYRLTIYDEKDPNITDNYGTYGLFYSPEQAQMAADEFKAKYITEDMKEGIHYVESTTITEEPQYSMTVIDQHTGYVVALAGGRGEKKSNMGINRAIDATRQPGSTFKILASYVAALDVGGFSPGSSMDEAPFTWGDWTPSNWDDNYAGFCTMREGITMSRNIVTARFMKAVGVETNFNYVESMGISTLRREPDENGETDMVGSLCLGSGSVTNLELCGAYASIANEGVYIEPTLYTHITDKKGNVIYENVPESHRVMKETTAYMLCDMLQDVVTQGTGTICNFDWSMAIAGKTGTTDDSNDFAFVGFTPYYTCAVMAGFDYVSYPEVYYNCLGGYSLNPDGSRMLDSSAHKYLWNTVMAAIHEPLESKDSFFEQPEGITYVAICKDSGKLPGPYCALDPRGNRVTYDMCEVGNEPTEVCDHHVQVTICSESGKIATEFCPSTQTAVRITRTEEEIEEIGASNLSLIDDWEYAVYDAKYAAYAPNSSSTASNSSTATSKDYVAKYTNECDLHRAPKEESSNITDPANSSGAGGESSSSPPDNSHGSEESSSPNSENTGG